MSACGRIRRRGAVVGRPAPGCRPSVHCSAPKDMCVGMCVDMCVDMRIDVQMPAFGALVRTSPPRPVQPLSGWLHRVCTVM